MLIVWVDLETGGTDETMHQITQIAAVATEGPPDFKEVDWFERKIRLVSGRYSKEALELQNYDSEAWEREAIPTFDALEQFIEWIGPFRHDRTSKRTGRAYKVAHMGGFNAGFDGDFLRAACERADLWMPLTNWTGGIIDLLPVAKWWFGMQGQWLETFTLEYLCEVLGIPLKAHDALDDVRATVELARRMAK